jgi:hypothetical protein
MKSSSESMAFKDGEPCSVMGVDGPWAVMAVVLRVLAGSSLDASVTHSSTFRFLD